MKKLLIIFAICIGLLVRKTDANYDAFGSSGSAPYGGMGHYIPTTHYIRLGAGINIGGLLHQELTVNDMPIEYEYGLNLNFALGLNIWQMLRVELGWERSYYDIANGDTANLTMIFDLARRYRWNGDVVWHKTIVPFIGIGALGGWMEFEDMDDGASLVSGNRGWVYGWRGIAGIGFYLTETNAIDLMATYSRFYGNNIGWDGGDKIFSGLGANITWRASF